MVYLASSKSLFPNMKRARVCCKTIWYINSRTIDKLFSSKLHQYLMPSTVTFIKINHSNTLLIRIHVNRKKLLSSRLFHSAIDLSARTKALLTLKKINYIRISNKDITSLTKAIENDVLELLLHTPVASLMKRLIPNEVPIAPNTICIDLNKTTWKCHFVAPIQFILNLRQRLGILWTEEEMVIYLKVKSAVKPSRMRLLTKDAAVQEPTVLIEDEEDIFVNASEDISADTKKTQLSYSYKKQIILNDLGGLIDLYIYDRPHK